MKNLKLASQETEHRTIVNVSGVEIGRDFVVIAGPCSVESEKQILDTAMAVKAAGADMLRGGAGRPVLLKRGMYSTLEEWLNCAEYILSEGNPDVILCERG
ncbi:3-deoxy-7-phosphoheptulonate synthase, partial [Candidatus Saccharibacteria bacterium]|nr:3-deoxy-7-phosphoheptulonate synthase [Candidatus Saccharibacteria bacterium]